MNRRNARFTLTRLTRLVPTVLLLEFLAPLTAHADFYFHPWESHHSDSGRLSLDLDLDYYDTKSNFDPITGSAITPVGFTDYTRLETNAWAAYGLGQLTLYGRLSWGYVNLNSMSIAGTSFGLTDQAIGANFRIIGGTGGAGPAGRAGSSGSQGGSSLDLQVQVDVPAYSNASMTTPALGDGSMDFTAGGLGRIALWHSRSSRLALAGGAGYTYRTAGYSADLPWSVGLEYLPVSSGLSIRVMDTGIYSLKTDLTNNPALSSSGSGGNFITGAINPSLMSGIIQLGYQFSPGTRAYVSVQDSVMGQAAPNGLCASAGLQTYFGGKSTYSEVTPAEDHFVSYSLEARVRRVNDRLGLVKIDKGSQDGVEVGQIFDIFKLRKDGSLGAAVARAKVSQVNVSESALSVLDYYQEIWIDQGFIARRVME